MITVITPYKDSARWIARAVNSLRVQDGEFEFILINDGSMDDGEQIARDAAAEDPRFIFLDNEHSSGVSGARNTGLDHATGDWVTFLDADDELMPDAGKIFARMIVLDGEPNIIQANNMHHSLRNDRTWQRGATNAGWYGVDKLPSMWCYVWNKLYRRDFIERHNIRFSEYMQFGEDELFNLECLKWDGRIRHTQLKTITILRHIGNVESLAKSRTPEDLAIQSRELARFLLRLCMFHGGETKDLRQTVLDLLSEHWGSKTYHRTFIDRAEEPSMLYIIMCGGGYACWDTPRQMSVVNGEEIVARTIRLLREAGINNIAISSNNPAFKKYGLPVLEHSNDYYTRGWMDSDGDWCDAFYLTDEPVCYIFGDVVFSPEAIRTIVDTKTDDIELFGSMSPFAGNYVKKYREPFALKVQNPEHLRNAIAKTKELTRQGKFKREPIMWELWQVIKGTTLNRTVKNYTAINDYTCDVDEPSDIELMEKVVY